MGSGRKQEGKNKEPALPFASFHYPIVKMYKQEIERIKPFQKTYDFYFFFLFILNLIQNNENQKYQPYHYY